VPQVFVGSEWADSETRLAAVAPHPGSISERYIVEVFLVDIHVVPGALLPPLSATALATATAISAVAAGAAGASEELDVFSDYVDLVALGAVLGLPGAELEPSLD
jgi:hypothetical protein